MNWESIYLTCFFAGLLLTAASLLFGGHVHIPVHLPQLHVPHVHMPHGADAKGSGASPFNLTTLVIFLTWFGATGYLVSHYRSNAAGLALTAALLVGFVGGSATYLFMARVLFASERPLRNADFEMVGVLGHVSSSIRPSGTGELIYAQQGTRRSCGARSEDGSAIDRGTEVIVMHYDRGIAYVRPFEELKESSTERPVRTS